MDDRRGERANPRGSLRVNAENRRAERGIPTLSSKSNPDALQRAHIDQVITWLDAEVGGYRVGVTG